MLSIDISTAPFGARGANDVFGTSDAVVKYVRPPHLRFGLLQVLLPCLEETVSRGTGAFSNDARCMFAVPVFSWQCNGAVASIVLRDALFPSP